MGRASRTKQQMRAQLRDRPQLIQKVRQQVELLRVLGSQFDQGHRIVGYPLATTIRVLVHNTGSSHALLAQLGELTKMPFMDTSLPINPSNMLPSHNGLVLMKMTVGQGIEWVPNMEVPPIPSAQPRDARFAQWWNTDVLRDGQRTTWSRRRMVLTIANKEGGAHIDPEQPVDVRAIEEENSMGWVYHDPIEGDQPMSQGPLLPSVRQIAHELDQSISRHLAPELGLTPA